MTPLDAVLRRERAVVAAGLAALTVLAWLYVWSGAGMGVSALDMTRLALFPHAAASYGGAVMPGATAWTTVAAMWWVMMIAMMTPSAAPLVLLYGRVLRHHGGRTTGASPYAPPALLVAGYLLAWLAFSAAAATLQLVLQRLGLVATMLLSSRSAVLSASILLAAGVYQLSPLKHACLRRCRSPVEFLTRCWRPGPVGALAIGIRHGAWCVGCCWLLMALLFVGGVMNVVWIALLALLVLAEKIAPAGSSLGRIAGAMFLAWGCATLIVSLS